MDKDIIPCNAMYRCYIACIIYFSLWHKSKSQPISVMRLRIILLHMQKSPAYGYNWEDVSSGKTEHLVQSFVIHCDCIACNVNFSLLHKQLPVSILRLCIVLHCTLGSIVFLSNLPIWQWSQMNYWKYFIFILRYLLVS